MLTFIKTQEVNFDPEDWECRSYDYGTSCGLHEDYIIPAFVEDEFKWIQEVGGLLDVYDISDLKVGITQCGQIIAEDVGTVSLLDGQLFVTATIPADAENLQCYEFIIYVDYQSIDCSIFECSDLQELIDSDLSLGDVLNCSPIEDWGCDLVYIGDLGCADSDELSGIFAGLSIGQILVINGDEYEIISFGFFTTNVTPATLPTGDTVQVYIYE